MGDAECGAGFERRRGDRLERAVGEVREARSRRDRNLERRRVVGLKRLSDSQLVVDPVAQVVGAGFGGRGNHDGPGERAGGFAGGQRAAGNRGEELVSVGDGAVGRQQVTVVEPAGVALALVGAGVLDADGAACSDRRGAGRLEQGRDEVGLVGALDARRLAAGDLANGAAGALGLVDPRSPVVVHNADRADGARAGAATVGLALLDGGRATAAGLRRTDGAVALGALGPVQLLGDVAADAAGALDARRGDVDLEVLDVVGLERLLDRVLVVNPVGQIVRTGFRRVRDGQLHLERTCRLARRERGARHRGKDLVVVRDQRVRREQVAIVERARGRFALVGARVLDLDGVAGLDGQRAGGLERGDRQVGLARRGLLALRGGAGDGADFARGALGLRGPLGPVVVGRERRAEAGGRAGAAAVRPALFGALLVSRAAGLRRADDAVALGGLGLELLVGDVAADARGALTADDRLQGDLDDEDVVLLVVFRVLVLVVDPVAQVVGAGLGLRRNRDARGERARFLAGRDREALGLLEELVLRVDLGVGREEVAVGVTLRIGLALVAALVLDLDGRADLDLRARGDLEAHRDEVGLADDDRRAGLFGGVALFTLLAGDGGRPLGPVEVGLVGGTLVGVLARAAFVGVAFLEILSVAFVLGSLDLGAALGALDLVLARLHVAALTLGALRRGAALACGADSGRALAAVLGVGAGALARGAGVDRALVLVVAVLRDALAEANRALVTGGAGVAVVAVRRVVREVDAVALGAAVVGAGLAVVAVLDRANALAVGAEVFDRAGVAVVTLGVGDVLVAAALGRVAGVAGAGVLVVAVLLVGARALAARVALVVVGAGVAVVARRAVVRLVHAALGRVARVRRAGVLVVAHHRRVGANAVLACVGGAQVAVVAIGIRAAGAELLVVRAAVLVVGAALVALTGRARRVLAAFALAATCRCGRVARGVATCIVAGVAAGRAAAVIAAAGAATVDGTARAAGVVATAAGGRPCVVGAAAAGRCACVVGAAAGRRAGVVTAA